MHKPLVCVIIKNNAGHREQFGKAFGVICDTYLTESFFKHIPDYVTHSHEEHGHHHSHAQTKAVLNRLSRAIGHLESIKRMVEDGRDCSEVLIQLSAVKSAINNTGKIILQDHIEHCIVDAVEHGDKDAIKELERAIDRFMK